MDMETLSVRDALDQDYDDAMRIYRYAQDFMIETGNPNQWAHRYPEPELIRQDIENGVCKLICSKSGVHGVFAFFLDADPTYAYIEDGQWPKLRRTIRSCSVRLPNADLRGVVSFT